MPASKTTSTTKARALLAEQAKRRQFPDAVQAVVDGLFAKQREALAAPGKRKVFHPGRRSGKTHLAVARALQAAAQHPGATIPVFERVLTSEATKTFWRGLREIDETYKLGAKFHDTYKTMTLRNGAIIQMLGADTIPAADKARGGKFPFALVDEAGTFRSVVLEYLLTEVVEPALIDLDGEVWVLGTPNLVPNGMFHALTMNREWATFHWTLLDNDTIGPKELDPAARRAWREEYLASQRRAYGWTETSPKYLREYMGQWVGGDETRVYARFKRGSNTIPALPMLQHGQSWTYALGVDLGFNDPTAFVVWARRDGDPTKYVVESYEESELIPSAIAAHIERLRTRYTFRAIVADTGGAGKATVEEMRQRFGLPILAAQKRDKAVFIEHVNGDLANGRIQIVTSGNTELIDDMLALEWNDARTNSADGARDHLCDAFLYGEREINTWVDLGEREGPAPGTPAAWRLEAEAMEAAELEKLQSSGDDSDDWREKYWHDD